MLHRLLCSLLRVGGVEYGQYCVIVSCSVGSRGVGKKLKYKPEMFPCQDDLE